MSLNKFNSETSAEYRNRFLNTYPHYLIISSLFDRVYHETFASTFFPLLIELCNISEKNNEMIFEQWRKLKYNCIMTQNLFKWMLVKNNETRYKEIFTRIENATRNKTGYYYLSIFDEPASMSDNDTFFANIEKFIKNKGELKIIYNEIEKIYKDLEKCKKEEKQRNNNIAFNKYSMYYSIALDILNILNSKFYRM